VVPLDDVGRQGQRAEHRIGVGGIALGDQGGAHLRPFLAHAHPAAGDLGQELGTEADRERRQVGLDRLAQQGPHAGELGAGPLVVHRRLRPAEHEQAVVPVEGRR
jgi:hypothetical protein